MGEPAVEQIEALFAELTPEDKVSIIRYGMYLLRFELQQRRVLAEDKLRRYKETYHTTLAALNAEGLPDDAGYEIREDVIQDSRFWILTLPIVRVGRMY
jgi:hypothetical protein